MDEQRQDDQLEPTYGSSVLIRDVALKNCWKQWTIGTGGKRESGISVLMARYHDDEVFLSKTNNIHTFIRVQESISNTNNFHLVHLSIFNQYK